jgi:hypothetical protein
METKSKFTLNVPKIKHLNIIIFLIVVCSTGAYALHNQEQNTVNPLFQGVDTEARPMHITEVNNTVYNMLSGQVSASSAHDYIFEERFFAKKFIDGTPGEMAINARYIAYLSECLNVVDTYSTGSIPDLAKMERLKKEVLN